MIHRALGACDYDEALRLQQAVHAARLRGDGEDTLFTLEHSPGLLTGGRRALDSNLLADPAEMDRAGVQRRRVERGGDWTWHGPGQLVAYPILRLADWGLDVPSFVAGLESAMAALASEALGALDLGVIGRRSGYPGLWIDGPGGLMKLGAVGVHVRRFVTLHGLALNLDPRPWGFDFIRPCGLSEPVTSLARLLEGVGADPAGLPSIAAAGERLVELLPRAWRGELEDAPTVG